MKIGINASSLSSKKGGASFYIYNLIKAMATVTDKESFVIFTTKANRDQFKDLPANFSIIDRAPLGVMKRLIWEQIILPFVCRKNSIDVLLSPNYTAPLFTPGFKSVVTIHDLSFFPLEKLYPRSRRFFKIIIHLSVRFSNAVIAVSEFTKNDILCYIGSFTHKVKVVYEGADSRFQKAVTQEQVRKVKEKYKLPENYILFTGFLEPRKNLIRLLQAYSNIKTMINHKLVIAGGNGWWYDKTYTKVTELDLQNHVIFTGYVDDDDLPPLYTGATLFVFPSLYEGFGIAALEAISCGTPVLASQNTALPEVVRDAGIYVDPYNVKDISNKLILTTDEPTLQKLRSNCQKVSSLFSWKKAAEETLQILLQ